MKVRRGLIYLSLISAFLSGVLLPKSVDRSPSSLVFSKENGNEEFKEVTVSAKLKAEGSSKVLSADSREVTITDRGDNLLVLINKNIRLPETYEPKDLVYLNEKIGKEKRLKLRKEAAAALSQLVNSAKEAGLSIVVTSAYRSYWSQLATYKEKVALLGPEATKNYGARPGHSQHQLGTAVDFQVTDPKIINWLEENSYKYGFVLSYPLGKETITGYRYEPWHYRYIGVQDATNMVRLGIILEEYLQKFGVW